MSSSRLRDLVSIVLTVLLALFLLFVFQPSMLPLARLAELRAALPAPDAVATPDAPPTSASAAPSPAATIAATSPEATATTAPTPRPAATATVTDTPFPLSRVGLTRVDTPVPPAPTNTAVAPTATAAKLGAGTPTPWSGAYVVQNGDTLATIATKFGVTVAQLAAENNISNLNTLITGVTLKVPGR